MRSIPRLFLSIRDVHSENPASDVRVPTNAKNSDRNAAVLAMTQMGVHLVFFMHISSAPDSTNNILSLAFGIFVVGLVIFGSMIIMANLNQNMTLNDQMLDMHLQR